MHDEAEASHKIALDQIRIRALSAAIDAMTRRHDFASTHSKVKQ